MTASRRPTIRDVAEAAGVSTATVSRVLTGKVHVKPERKARIQAAIDHLGYSPNGLTRSIFSGRANSIGILIGDLRSPFYVELVRGLETVTTPAGHLPLFANTSRDPVLERRLIKLMDEQRVRGVVVTTGPDTDDLTRQMASMGTQCVLITRKLAKPCNRVHSIRLDDRASGRLAWEHLREGGRRRIAVVTNPLNLATQHARFAGVTAAATDADNHLDPALVQHATASTPDAAYQATIELIERNRSRRGRPSFDAVIATSGMLTHGVYCALYNTNLQMPGDVGFVGFDDFPWAAHLRTPLTLIDQPAHAMGRRAAEIILTEPPKNRPVNVVVEPTLMARESSAPKSRGRT